MLDNFNTILSHRIDKETRGNYLILSLRDGQALINYQAEMLENNEGQGIVPLTTRVVEGVTEIAYDISVFNETIEEHIRNGQLTGGQFIDFFDSVVGTILDSGKFLLEESRFELSPDAVFVDSALNPKLIYVPVEGVQFSIVDDFRKLFTLLSDRVEIKPGVGDMLHSLSRELNNDNFNFKGFGDSLKKLKKQPQTVQNRTAPEPAAVRAPQPQQVQQRVSQPRPPQPQVIPQQNAAKGMPAASKETSDGNLLARNNAVSKKGKEKPKQNAAKSKGNNNQVNLKVIILQVILLILLAAGYFIGIYETFETMQLFGVIVIIFALDYLVARKLAGEAGVKKKPAAKKEIKKQSKQKKTKQQKPAAVRQNDIVNSQILSNQKRAVQARPSDNAPMVRNSQEATAFSIEDEGTVIMTDALQNLAYLVNNDGGAGTRISINANPFIIGKSHQGTDMICDNKHVSRQHAQIFQESGTYYLMDLSSTNGTYLNGAKIDGQKPYLLTSGDEITFAKAMYTFISE